MIATQKEFDILSCLGSHFEACFERRHNLMNKHFSLGYVWPFVLRNYDASTETGANMSGMRIRMKAVYKPDPINLSRENFSTHLLVRELSCRRAKNETLTPHSEMKFFHVVMADLIGSSQPSIEISSSSITLKIFRYIFFIIIKFICEHDT